MHHPLTNLLKYRLRDEELLERAPRTVVAAVLFTHDMLCLCGPDGRHELTFEAEELASDFRVLLIENKKWLEDVFRNSRREVSEPID